jgi:hypothetical protein
LHAWFIRPLGVSVLLLLLLLLAASCSLSCHCSPCSNYDALTAGLPDDEQLWLYGRPPLQLQLWKNHQGR